MNALTEENTLQRSKANWEIRLVKKVVCLWIIEVERHELVLLYLEGIFFSRFIGQMESGF